MSKYEYNLSVIPKEVKAADAMNALVALIAAVDPKISQKDYDTIPDWAKAYWKSLPVTPKLKKGKK